MLLAREKGGPSRGAAAAAATVICTKVNSSLTFVRPLREQVLLLLVVSTSDHHTGQSTFHSWRLLCRLSWEVLDPQLVVPGLRGTQLARTTIDFTEGAHMRVDILSMKQPVGKWRTTVFYISDARRLPVQLPQQLPAVLLLFQKNLCKRISTTN